VIRLPGIIPIQIDPLFWILAFGLGWYYTGQISLTLIWGLVILFSILFHEFGHALTALAFGQQSTISLIVLGGVTRRQGPALSKWKEFLIILNGPLAGLLLALISWLLIPFVPIKEHHFFGYALLVSLYVNFFWTIVNLLPVQPLDGGHLLLILMQGIFGHRGYKVTYFLSIIFAVLLAIFAFTFQQLFIGALFLIFAFESYRSWKDSLYLTKEDQLESFQSEWKSAEEAFKRGDLFHAKEMLREILNKSKHQGVIFLKASELLALILNQEGKENEAYDLLKPIEKSLDLDGLLLLHEITFKSGHLKEAIELGNKIHKDYANSETAYLNALAHAELHEERPSIGWLKTAIDEGLKSPLHAMEDVRFDPIRSTKGFLDLLQSVKKDAHS